jgi:phosphoglycerate dehydrogenase-like enzyme
MIGIKRRDPEPAKAELWLDWVGNSGDLIELLARADQVVLALPVTADSQNIIDAKAFATMKKDAFLINLSRGGLVDHDALKKALASGQIAGAGLDVFWEEPPDPDDPIFNYNIMATPHIGGSTDVSMHGIVKGVAENIRRIAAGKLPHHLK